jgi:hypothetical protein
LYLLPIASLSIREIRYFSLGRELSYRRKSRRQYSLRKKGSRSRLVTLKTRKWGVIAYPKGTKPVVVEVKIEGAVGKNPSVQTVVIKEGLGVKRETEIPILVKALREKAKRELAADQKAEFSIHFPKTRKKPVKFVAAGTQPLQPRIIYHPHGGEPPRQLKEDIKKEWKKHPKRKTATDLEALAYLSSSSLTAPLDGEHTRIYLYLSRKYLKSKGWKKFDGSMAFLKEHKLLSDYEKRLLQKLKDWIWKQQQKDLAERKRRAKRLLKEVPRS